LGLCEALAIGSLVLEAPPSHERSGRRSRHFSHRHAVLHDVENGARYVPLDNIRAGQSKFLIIDSMLSENAALGFELGFSFADPHKLVIWRRSSATSPTGPGHHRSVHRELGVEVAAHERVVMLLRMNGRQGRSIPARVSSVTSSSVPT